ncbi:alpha-amylase [Parapedobacter pyrenivorans]|uniref:Alpha-amylase n=1 Tax=Parapedobacter pyrenivorans TaxID=1305674 RepID=A0A917HZB0_9SPHI|nr:alpha-amylase family glycosyl hydrolase [Parapedobacter pyrenivorans]GGG97322.1 alpha-amylase [Parapedobacter pyrenivorans]
MRKFFLGACMAGSLIACNPAQEAAVKDEIIYHVFQRSFYDSNGDQHGDLNGLRMKLDYLQELGVTSILMTPLYESFYYHNYYSSDFSAIDSTYGTEEEFLQLVREIHRRGMKIYMDMETQYVTEDHTWYKDSYGNPSSSYSEYILYDDAEQRKPSSIVFDIHDLKGYDGTVRKITTVNLLSEKVKQYNRSLFSYWLDPNQDGNFDDGVDGFRLDHMMDDLDNKRRLTNLFKDFWVPLIDSLKSINPAITIMAEQADWGSYGIDYLENAGVDWVFGFRIQQAIRSFDKDRVAAYADTTFARTPQGKNQVIFIENHDIPRFATAMAQDEGKEKVGATLNLLLGGIPSLYYGQEIGMLGDSYFGKYGGITDANEIPYREAFEWHRDKDGEGMAYWYRGSGPWWDTSTVKSNDGISYEEQKADANSLWNTYRTLIALRKQHPVLISGHYEPLENTSNDIFTFLRTDGQQQALVAVNFSATPEQLSVSLTAKGGRTIYGNGEGRIEGSQLTSTLTGYETQVWLLNQ